MLRNILNHLFWVIIFFIKLETRLFVNYVKFKIPNKFNSGTIISPSEYVGAIIGLCVDRRGVQKTSINIDERRVMMTVFMPLSEIVLDFHDQLKSISSGYASFDYEPQGYHTSSIVKMEVFVNGQSVDELSRIIHSSKATAYARDLVNQLREKIPRQMIQIAIQACVNGKVLARETLKAYRKDVTAKLVNFYSIRFNI